MTNGGDAAEQIVKISLEGVDYAIRIAGAGAKNIAAMLMALMKSKKSQPPTLKVSGAERLKRMLKSGRPLDVFSVREKDIRVFAQEAKKYGIVYCAVREKEPKADGMVDVLVRKEDSPKINRVMERLQYATVNKTTIKSEIVKAKAEKGAEPESPDKSDKMDVDSFLDSVLPGEGKTKDGQNEAIQPPNQQTAPEVTREDFFTEARTKPNPSERGSESISNPEKKISEPSSVKEEIQQIRSELKEKAEKRNEEPTRGKKTPQQTTRHRQPDTTRKPKNKSVKEER